MGRVGQRARVFEGRGFTASSTVSKELWDLVRPPDSGTSSQHPSLNCSLGSHAPQIRILLGIGASPGNDLVMPLWTRLGCALARLGWPKKKKVLERTGGWWSLQGGSAGRGTSASLS